MLQKQRSKKFGLCSWLSLPLRELRTACNWQSVIALNDEPAAVEDAILRCLYSATIVMPS